MLVNDMEAMKPVANYKKQITRIHSKIKFQKRNYKLCLQNESMCPTQSTANLCL